MIWNVVSDSSCDLRMASFQDSPVRVEIVPLRIQVGERIKSTSFPETPDFIIRSKTVTLSFCIACPKSLAGLSPIPINNWLHLCNPKQI